VGACMYCGTVAVFERGGGRVSCLCRVRDWSCWGAKSKFLLVFHIVIDLCTPPECVITCVWYAVFLLCCVCGVPCLG
jgi:hypothetical protein